MSIRGKVDTGLRFMVNGVRKMAKSVGLTITATI